MTKQINDNGKEPISKTRKKQEMKALQKIGERLVELSDKQLTGLRLPSRLFDAVHEAKDMRSHGARRRQIKYIGAIIREMDPEPIKSALAQLDRNKTELDAAFHHLENLRDGLLSGDSRKFTEIVNQYPHTDRQRFRQLVRNAIKEKDAEKGTKHSRALFKYLKELS